MTAPRRSAAQVCAALALLLLTSPDLRAAEPEIRALSVRGLQVGGTTTLVIDGDDLGKAPRLLLPFALKQELKPGATDKRATFDVTLDGKVVPGYYQLRLVAETGVSLPILIGVDALPQLPLGPSVAPLPAALHGVVSGSSVVKAAIPGKAGQKVVVEVEAQRLGSKLRPVVHLVDGRGLQLAWAWTTPSLFGDARLEATLPADGTYTVTLHDAEYAAPGGSFFRLKVGQWGRVDQVFPPVVTRGQKQAVEILGSGPPARTEVTAGAGARVLPLAWPTAGPWSGPRPFVRVSPHPELVEQDTPEDVQPLPAGRVAVAGRLLAPYEEDRYRLPVTPGGKLRLEVQAERFGSPIDTALVIRSDKNALLTRAEDSPTGIDPVLEYTVPANVESLVVGVADAQGRGGPDGLYRLVVTPLAEVGTGFQLVTPAERVSLPPGTRRVVPVLIERDGHEGSVEVSVADLPTGVKLENTTIPAGAEGTLVMVRRDGALAEAAITRWQGKAGGQASDVVVQGHPLEQLQPWLAQEVPVAPAATQEGGLQIDWRGLPADTRLVPARKLTLPVKVTRSDVALPVRLTLITTQRPPLVNGQPNRNLMIREERAVEIAPKAGDGDLIVLVPPELPGTVYDLTIQADLLSADKRRVLAVAHAPVRRLEVSMPVAVELSTPARVELTQDAKKGPLTFAIKGKVVRREGLTGDVTVSLTGLPAGGQAGPVTVKAADADFTLNVTLPANLAPGEVRGLALSALGTPDAKQPAVRVRSREVRLTAVVKSGK